MPKLHINRISDVREISAQDGPVTIGRSSENAIVLASNGVSRHHCVIETVDGTPRIRDLESRHGTYVNGERVTDAALASGDTIRVGRFEIEFVDPRVAKAAKSVETAPGISIDAGDSSEADRLRDELARKTAEFEERRVALERDLAEAGVASRTAIADAASAAGAAAEAAAAALEEEQRRRAEAAAEHERKEREIREQNEIAERELREHHEVTERELRERQEETERELREIRVRSESAERESAARGEEIVRLGKLLDEEMERAENAERSIENYDTVGTTIKESAQRLSTIQIGLEEVERLWLEIDELAADLGDGDDAALEDVLRQRETVAQQLEAAHAARDDALAELYSVLEGFRRLPAVGKSGKRAPRGRGLFSAGRIIGPRTERS